MGQSIVGDPIGKRILALVVPHAGNLGDTFGSAGRVAPGIFITALHCVRDCLAPRLGLLDELPQDAMCGIVPVSTIEPDTNLDDVERQTAKVIWPPPGTPFAGTPDVAVLQVGDDNKEPGDVRTAGVQRNDLHAFDVVAYGYPMFSVGDGASGANFADRYVAHLAMGALVTSDGGTGYHQFQVTGDAASQPAEWKGMSGALVIERVAESGMSISIVGVVARHWKAGQGNSLRVVALDALDEGFFKAARLPLPRAVADAGTGPIREYALLLDRSDEVDMLLGHPSQPVATGTHPALVVAVSSGRDDCHALFMKRLAVELQWRFGNRRDSILATSRRRAGPYAKEVSIEIGMRPERDVRHLLYAFYRALPSKIAKAPAPMPVKHRGQDTPVAAYEAIGRTVAKLLSQDDTIGLLILRLLPGGVGKLEDIAETFQDFIFHLMDFASWIEPRALPVALVVNLGVGDGSPDSTYGSWTQADRFQFDRIVDDVGGTRTNLGECTADHITQWYSGVLGTVREHGPTRLPVDGGHAIIRLILEIAADRHRADAWRMATVVQAVERYSPAR